MNIAVGKYPRTNKPRIIFSFVVFSNVCRSPEVDEFIKEHSVVFWWDAKKSRKGNGKGYYFSSVHSPRPSAPASGPIYFSTVPSPNYFFTAPVYQNYFFTALMYQNYFFTALLVENISCIVKVSNFYHMIKYDIF